MSFDSVTIKNYFELEDEDSEEYRTLYLELNYDLILKKLTNGKSKWKKRTSNQVQSFLMTRLTDIAKSWLYFVSSKLIPTKHISIV